MGYRKTLLYNTLGLPAYWAACRRASAGMEVTEEKIFYGKHRRQYVLLLKGVASRPDKYAFYFHGGAWTFGEPATFTPAAIPWLARGYTVVLPSYRRLPTVGLNRIVADCRAALAALAPPGPVTDVHVGGISAGAHLAALLALHPEWWRAEGWPTGPQKALLCAGPLHLSALWPQTLFSHYTHLDPGEILSEATPKLQWQLLHGTDDGMVSYRHSTAFYDKLVGVGQVANLLTIPQGTHLDAGRWMFAGVGTSEVNAFLDEPPVLT